MEKIRILHVVSSLSKSAGVMSVIMNYYRHINKEKVQFDFLFFKDFEDTYKEEIEQTGGRVFLVTKPSISKEFRNQIAVFFKQHQGEYTALHIHEVYLTFLLAPAARKYGIDNIITHSHTTMYSDKKLNAIRNKILCSRLNKQANYYFACSKDAGKFLYGNKSLAEGKLTIINNAVNCDKFRYNADVRKKLRNEMGLTGNLVIGHVGRFNEQKNHDFLIDIFNKISKENSNMKLVLVGEGPLYEQTKAKVSGLNLDSTVLFLGKREDVSDLLQAMDIFLLPSLFEGLPVVGVEAQVSGLPIVMSTNITREIGLMNAHYIELEKTAEDWANEIVNIQKNYDRANAANLLMENGFDISIEASKLEKIYMNMTDK